jgi:hypothetical protein
MCASPPLEKVEPNSVAKKFVWFGSTFLKGGKGGKCGNIILLKQFKPISLYMNNNHI